jgi:lipoprotein-releasing system permease protein
VPQKNEMEPGDFKRVILRFEISGIISFGKYEFDERLLVTNDQFLIAMGLLSKRAPGLILGLKDSDLARETADRLRSKLSDTNRVRDWKEFSENLFEAVKIERVVIFFVIMVIVIAAAFNVSITQYINVVRKYADIAILKTLGVSQKNLIKIFCIQGLFLGVIGVFIGFILGYLMCFGFEYLEANYNILPFSVYKVDHIKLHLRGWDALYIVVSSIIVCLVSSYAPALKGANLKPVEGLRYE